MYGHVARFYIRSLDSNEGPCDCVHGGASSCNAMDTQHDVYNSYVYASPIMSIVLVVICSFALVTVLNEIRAMQTLTDDTDQDDMYPC